MDKMDGICESVGRDPKTLERSVAILVDFEDAYGRPGQTFPRLGTPTDRGELMRYVEIGVFARAVLPRSLQVEGIEKLAPVLDILDRG